MTKLLTLKEIAKELGAPESSLRKYREIFHAFIPSVGDGRSRRYRHEAIEVLNEIRILREEKGMPWDAISEELAKKYPMDAVSTEIPAPEAPAHAPERPAAPTQHSYSVSPTHSAPVTAAPIPDSKLNERLAAMSERQAMMLNAVAIEILQTFEKAGKEQQKDARNIAMNMARAMEAMYHSFAIAASREEAMLADMGKKVESLELTLKKSTAEQSRMLALTLKAANEAPRVEKAAPAPAQAPASNNGANAETARQLAELKKALIAARENNKKKDQMILEFKTALDATKRENADLRQMSASGGERFSDEEEGGYEPKSSSRKKTIFGRFSRK